MRSVTAFKSYSCRVHLMHLFLLVLTWSKEQEEANRVCYASTSNNRTRTHTNTRLTGQSFETYSISLSIWSLSPPQTSPVTSLLMADLNPPLTGLCYPGSGEMQIDSRSEVAFFWGPEHITHSVISGLTERITGKCQSPSPAVSVSHNDRNANRRLFDMGRVSHFLMLLCLSHMKIRYRCLRWVIDSYQTWANIVPHTLEMTIHEEKY